MPPAITDREIRDIIHDTLKNESGVSEYGESHYKVARATAEYVVGLQTKKPGKLSPTRG